MLRVVVDNSTRRKQLAWLQTIQDETGWNQSELARRAGISHATLSKFRNDPDNLSVLETVSVGKIAAIAPIPHYEVERSSFPDGFREGEAEPLGAIKADVTGRAIAAMRQGEKALDPWVLRSRALENIGYLPGDIVMVDLSISPKEGDVVCAQVSDRDGNIETAFRIFHRPFLLAASSDPELLKPLLIDDRVQIMGVVAASLRPRTARAAS